MKNKVTFLFVFFLSCFTFVNSYGAIGYNSTIFVFAVADNDTEALDLYERGLKIYQSGNQKEGLKYMVKAIEIWDKEIDANATAGDACMLVGRIYFNNKEFSKAQDYAEKALDIFSEIYDIDNSMECAKAFSFLGETYFMLNNYDDAYMNFASAYEIAKKLLGEDHKEVKQISLLMTASYSKMTGK